MHSLFAVGLFAGIRLAAGEQGLQFDDIAAEAGLTAPTWCGRESKPHILESQGTGLALFDYDDDGDLDLYLVNGWRLAGSEVVERGRNRLYRNDGDGRFEDVTERAGVGDDGWGSGAAVGDIDGDGDLDLFVTNFGPDVLYRNQGDGTFSVISDGPGLDGWSAGAVFFDADGDADLDLYVGGYIDCSLAQVLAARPSLDWNGHSVMVGPFGLEGLSNRYFENTGGGRFRDATVAAGLTDAGRFYSFGVVALDVEPDGDLDLYVANDSNPNYLYLNDGKGRFEEVGLWSGAALDGGGNAQAGMGLAAGDFNRDGRVDLVVTNFEDDASTMYLNLGDALFRDATREVGLHEPTFRPLSWGTVLADLDLDGDLDLFIANGHIYPQADRVKDTAYAQRNLLLENRGGHLENVSAHSGSGLAVAKSSRGVAAGDLDSDGDLDLTISNVDATPTLLRNTSSRKGSWAMVDAPAARRIRVEAGAQGWTLEAVSGGSYLSASDRRFHLGLGAASRIDRLRLFWASGGETLVLGLPAQIVAVVRR